MNLAKESCSVLSSGKGWRQGSVWLLLCQLIVIIAIGQRQL